MPSQFHILSNKRFHLFSTKSFNEPDTGVKSGQQPNIILMVADDLGYNDVSWHNPDIVSPNLELLARSGIILEQAYVQPICTPTRELNDSHSF
jgi:Sulfatase